MNTTIEWRGCGSPYSVQFNDGYYGSEDGLAEARHVFLTGNELPQRFHGGFHIAELGFGTGLNMMAVWQAWKQSGVPGALRFTSFEAFPLTSADIRRALAPFEEILPLAEDFLVHWDKGQMSGAFPDLVFKIILGDARKTVPQWNGRANAWFLDGFAPSRNPQMWQHELLHSVAEHTELGGTFATFSAAGEVRRSLSSAGFVIEKRPGYGRKRHMCVGKIPVIR